VNGTDHPNTLLARDLLAAVYLEQQRADERGGFYQEVYDTKRRVLGPEHMDTLGPSSPGERCAHAGQVRAGRVLFKETLAAQDRVEGVDHPDAMATRASLATMLSDAGRFDESERLWRDLLGRMQRVLGRDHPDTANCLVDWPRSRSPGTPGGGPPPARRGSQGRLSMGGIARRERDVRAAQGNPASRSWRFRRREVASTIDDAPARASTVMEGLMRTRLILVLALAAAGLLAAAGASLLAAPPPKVQFSDTRLKNGLRVIIARTTRPVFSIAVTYNVGSRNEREAARASRTSSST